MRNQKQIAKRLERVKLANEILAWLALRGEKQGIYAYASVVGPFAGGKDVDTFEVWQAWDILKEAGRRRVRPGARWEIDSFRPIEAKENGDIIGV